MKSNYQPESRMREIRTYGSEGGELPTGSFPTPIKTDLINLSPLISQLIDQNRL